MGFPLGILSQDSRDLSKEIWITWGDTADQVPGMYINNFTAPTNSQIRAKTADGNDSPFYLYHGYDSDDPEYLESWQPRQLNPISPNLPIINKYTGVFFTQQYDEDYYYYDQYLNIIRVDMGTQPTVEIYAVSGNSVLGGNSVQFGFDNANKIIYNGTNTTPVTKLNTDDPSFDYVGQLTFPTYPWYQLQVRRRFLGTDTGTSYIRAIVIKLL